MFTPTEREAIRERLVTAACADADIKGLAHTGSYATGAMDRWSDVDLALAVRGDLNQVIERWTTFIHAELGAIHHWDLPVETSIYRVYLLRTGLELDVGFIPEGEFGPIGPAWRKVFGAEHSSEHRGSHRGDNLLGLCWHHVMHAAACIDRGKPWQAEWLISQARHHVIEIECRRHGVLTDFGKAPTRCLRPQLNRSKRPSSRAWPRTNFGGRSLRQRRWS